MMLKRFHLLVPFVITIGALACAGCRSNNNDGQQDDSAPAQAADPSEPAATAAPAEAAAPPAEQAETPTASPGPNHIWTKGYWHWSGGRYNWQPGRWVVREGNRRWVEGRWDVRRGRHYWVPGHWR